MTREFWKSSGFHLTRRTADGWLAVTPELVLAYLTRPEVHPVETSCAREIALHEALFADPLRPVTTAEIDAIADPDAVEAYRIVLAFRDRLVAAGSVEGAYLSLIRSGANMLPPVFLDQMVHLILRNVLNGTTDPMRLRAAEIFFRDQSASLDDQRLLLADEEIVEMHARAGNETGLAQLLAESGTPLRQVELDVIGEDNAAIYWQRSDRFDTVVDFRFEQPALDAFARVIENWLAHMLKIEASVEPRPKIEDRDWRWHIGLDAEASRLLNTLYEGGTVSLDEMARIVGLFRMRLADDRLVIDRIKGRPIYLGLAMTAGKRVRMKPQNLLTNLPLVRAG